jgi:hypothetical protein
MRYAQRGGYTPAEQQRRERLRLEAAGRFACGVTIKEIARDLRVTEGSVRRWHWAWRDGGAEALRSWGRVSREKLSPQQWTRLELELPKGRPAQAPLQLRAPRRSRRLTGNPPWLLPEPAVGTVGPRPGGTITVPPQITVVPTVTRSPGQDDHNDGSWPAERWTSSAKLVILMTAPPVS